MRLPWHISCESIFDSASSSSVNNAVSSVVWPWRNAPTPKPSPPSRKTAAIQSAAMAAIGAILFWGIGHRLAGTLAWTMAAAVLLSGLFFPPAFAAIHRFGKRLGKAVGTLVTWCLLAPFFYLCFVPLRLALLLRGKDPLHRQMPPRAPSYWTPRKPGANPSQYKKQF